LPDLNVTLYAAETVENGAHRLSRPAFFGIQ